MTRVVPFAVPESGGSSLVLVTLRQGAHAEHAFDPLDSSRLAARHAIDPPAGVRPVESPTATPRSLGFGAGRAGDPGRHLRPPVNGGVAHIVQPLEVADEVSRFG
jgi:hypothetical protein